MSYIQSLNTFVTKTKVSSAKMNQNFATIKDAVNDNFSKISTNTSNISTLQEDVSSLSADMTSVSDGLSTVSGDLSTLQTTVSGLPTKTYVDGKVAEIPTFRSPDYDSANKIVRIGSNISYTATEDCFALFVSAGAVGQRMWRINGMELIGNYSSSTWIDTNACLFPVSNGDTVFNQEGSITLIPLK